MIEINTEEFLDKREKIKLIDIRSPIEFQKGHIPGATNLPLFSDEERKKVGTIYKKIDKEEAFITGLEFVANSTERFFQRLEKLGNPKEILIYCWRGGNRSKFFGYFLEAIEIRVSRLIGGYKAYKRFIQKEFTKKSKLIILSGFTGSGKTEKIHELKNLGEQIIDLEGLANHYGSAFGGINRPKQPSTEYFENLFYEKWKNFDLTKRIWLEDESNLIGKVHINSTIFQKMRNSQVIKIQIPIEARIKRLIKIYSDCDVEKLKSIFLKTKRMNNRNLAVKYLEENDFRNACKIALKYYDKTYKHGISKREKNKVITLKFKNDDNKIIAKKILESIN